MLKIDWEKIDKFYIFFSLVLVVMAVVVIFTFNGIFSAFNKAYEIDQTSVESELRVNKDNLEDAYQWTFERTDVPLVYKTATSSAQ